MSQLLIAIAGAVVGSLGTFVINLLQRSRKVIEYSVSSISLLRLNIQTDNTISVSVSKSILTGNEKDNGVTTPLSNVYGLQVNIINAGNQDIDKIDEIEIRFDSAAKIVKCETEPSYTKSYQIIPQRDTEQQNVCHISLPYINANDQVVAKIISTENQDSSCFVKAHGIGIKTRPARSLNSLARIGTLIYGISLLIGGIVITIDASIIHHLPYFIFDVLTVPAYIILTLGLIIFIIIQHLLSKEKKRITFSKDWDWKVPGKHKKSI